MRVDLIRHARLGFLFVLAACALTPPGWAHALPLAQGSTSASAGDLSVQRDLITDASTARKAGDYAAASAIVLEVVTDLLARPKPEQDAAWLKLLDLAGRAAWDAHDVRTAESAWKRVYEVRSTILPDDDPNLQSARQNLSIAIAELGDLQGARALQEKVLEVRSRALPEDDPDLQRIRQNLAITIRKLGDLQGARALQEKVLEVRTRALPEDHADLQAARANLAVTIRTLGDLTGAQTLQERVLEVFARTVSDDDPDLQGARASLAITMSKLGDLAGARALQEKVLEVFSRTLPDDYTDPQVARGNLAATLWMLGDLQAARALQEKVIEVFSRTLPDDHLDLQRARGNLALTIKNLGDLQGARALEEQVLEVRSRTLPGDDPDLQAARLNLAVTLVTLGDLAGARALQEKVLEVRSQSLPDDHPDLQLARRNLGATIYRFGELADARGLFEKVLEVSLRTLPEDHADLQAARQNLAATIMGECARQLRAGRGANELERARCAELIHSMCSAQVHAARTAILGSSSREAEERCANLAQQLDISLSFAQGCGVFEPLLELQRDSFVLAETTRGAALASAELTRRAASSPKYEALRVALGEASAEFASLAQKGSTSGEFDRARVRREAAEREIVALTQKLSGGRASGADLDVETLAAELAPGQALVTFRRYAKGRVEVADADQPAIREFEVASLCAFVVRGPGLAAVMDTASKSASISSLSLADLGPIEPIEAAARAWRAGLGVAADSRGVAASAVEARASSVHADGVRLRERILDPLIPLLAGAQRVVVVLDDVLHLVPLDALPLDDKTLVGDRWRIETRATLTELLSPSAPLEGQGAIVALGDADYGADTRRKSGDARASVRAAAAEDHENSPKPVAAEARPVARAGILRGSGWERGFSVLPGTGVEVRGIAQAFADAFGANATVELLQHAAASRESLLALAPKARYLHVATHGWFAPESIKSWLDPEPVHMRGGLGVRMSGVERVRGMSPMLLCGLALAGANLPEDAAARTPGLVTADELSTLDLSNCELAVLSACDTNVGERRAGQGVASLQKALQMAGARSVITSLWKVPDEATKELMLDFYRRLWVEKKPKWQALWEAKMMMRKAKDESGALKYTTRDWAAWVLTGEPN